MHSLRRTALPAARSARTTLTRQSRRYAHDEHGSHGHNAAPAGSGNESFGMGLWIPLACFPAGYLLYKASRTDKDNQTWVTRMIAKYSEKHEDLVRKNALHIDMMEQAGSDRLLFMNAKPVPFVDMKFPEIMNNGSPFNVQAGQQANMDKVIAKFKQEAYEDQERKMEALRNNQISSEQPLEAGVPRYRQVVLNKAIR